MYIREFTRKNGQVLSVVFSFYRSKHKQPNNMTLYTSQPVEADSAEYAVVRAEMEQRCRRLEKELRQSTSLNAFLTKHQKVVGCGRGHAIRRNDRVDDDGPGALSALRTLGARSYGLPYVMEKLFASMGLDTLVAPRRQRLNACLRVLSWGRLTAERISKRQLSQLLEEEYGIHWSEDSMYKAMDHLDDAEIERIQMRVARSNLALLNQKTVQLLLYDTTTFYFESVQADDFRCRGWSKDGKAHRTQVVFGMWMTPCGLPLGYKLFTGKTADVSTLLPALDEMQRRLGAQKTVVIADNGLLSEDNLAAITAAGHAFVMACSPRKLPKEIRTAVYNYDFEGGARIFEIGLLPPARTQLADNDRPLVARNYYANFSSKRARRDLHQLHLALKRAKNSTGRNHQALRGIACPDIRKFLSNNGITTLNPTAINRAMQEIGLYGVQASPNIDYQTAYTYYKQLYAIEHGFRDLKSDLQIRPTFHWKPERIRAHFALCYLAFAAIRRLRYVLRQQKPAPTTVWTTEMLPFTDLDARPQPPQKNKTEEIVTTKKILKELRNFKATIQRNPVGNYYSSPHQLTPGQQRILQAVQLKPKQPALLDHKH